MTTTILASDFCHQNEWFARFEGMDRTPLTITKPDGTLTESHGLLAIVNRYHINTSTDEVRISTLTLGTISAPPGTTITFVKPEGATCTRIKCNRRPA